MISDAEKVERQDNTTSKTEGKQGMTRREFLRLAAAGGAGYALANVARINDLNSVEQKFNLISSLLRKFNERGKEGQNSDTLIPIEQDGVEINLVKYQPFLKYKILDSKASSYLNSRIFFAQYRVGSLEENKTDQLFLDQGIFLVHQEGDGPKANWTDTEAEMTTKAMIRARLINGKFFNYEGAGIGFQVRHVNQLFFKKEGSWSFHPQGQMGFVSLPIEDLVHVRSLSEDTTEPTDDLFGEIAVEYNHHFNNLIDIWLKHEQGEETSLMPALIEGMGAYADYLATGRWRLTELPKEHLEQGLNPEESFYGTKIQDHITLAGMAIAEAEEKYPGVWAYLNHKLFIEAVKIYGGGNMGAEGKNKIFELLLDGSHPTIPLDSYLKFGDEFTKEGKAFSDWFKEQKIFFINP